MNELKTEWDYIRKMTEQEAYSVTIVSDNPDFNDLPNCLVFLNGDCTFYQDKRFHGETRIEALQEAYEYYQKSEAN